MVVHRVGDCVRGKTRKFDKKVDHVLQVFKESKQHSYDIQWDEGGIDRVSARSIELVTSSLLSTAPTVVSTTTFVGAVLDAQNTVTNIQITSQDAASDGSDDEEDDGLTVDGEDDGDINDDSGNVVAHGREWKPCENILIDPVARSHSRKTSFKWPQILQLGETICSKYFYLFYPTNTIADTLKFTNEKLQKMNKKKIDEGDFYRWLGL